MFQFLRSFRKLFFVVSLLFPAFALGNGFIVLKKHIPPHGQDGPAFAFIPGCIPFIKENKRTVDVTIKNQIAATQVTQEFETNLIGSGIGTYYLPVPKGAIITKFNIVIDGQPIKANVLNQDQAEKAYSKIVCKHQDQRLVEFIGHGMVKAKIPFPLIGKITVKLEYSEILSADNGSVKYHHPLSSATLSGITAQNVSIKLNVKADKPFVNLYSPTHNVDIQTPSLTEADVTCTVQSINQLADFIFYYTIPQDDLGFNILTYKNGDEDGYFLALVSPNNNPKTQPISEKNIVFVIDVSGSMYGKKIEQAKEALSFCLSNLNEKDKFNIVTFSSDVSTLAPQLLTASASQIKNAQNYVKTLKADSGTNIDKALEVALEQCPSLERALFTPDNKPTMIVFLTDGEPTEGECNIGKIIKNVRSKADEKNVRLFSFGVGHDVITTLLDNLALNSGGTSDYVLPDESIETKVTYFYKKIAHLWSVI